MTKMTMPLADAVLADLGEAVIVTDLDRSILYWNRAAERLYGWSDHEVLGRDIIEVTQVQVDDAHEGRVRRAIATGEPTLENYWVLRKDGERIAVAAKMTGLRDETDDIVAVTIVATSKGDRSRDAVAPPRALATIDQPGLHDEVTGLPTRALLHDRLERAMLRARRSGRRVAVVYGGIDGFQRLNETLGFGATDELLAEVGRRLCSATRASDTVGHNAGDEFVILLEDIDDAATASEIASRMANLCDTSFDMRGQAISLSVTWGIAIAGPDDTANSCLRDAANAMRIAKSA
jgi:diguanylate cyclase (GGDEF)-like protein/PAS domain S-box-containing protein